MLLRSALSEAELVTAQRRAIEAFSAARRAAEQAVLATATSREQRMDAERRREVLQAQHHAVVARSQAGAGRRDRPGTSDVPLRAVVAHRNEWFTGRLVAALGEAGVVVLCTTGNGAEAVGVCVAEQPDLVVVEERTAMISGEEVVRDVRRFVPTALVAAQVAYEDRVGALLDAGAQAAYARRVPPADLAADVLRQLAAGVRAPGA
jgi:CheY-like chemotaxis protein